jgi:two-component system NarL family sensor kinase
MSRRAAARLAWSLWVLSLTLVFLGLLLLILNWSRAGTHLLEYWPEDYWPEEMFVGVAFSTVGVLIASRHHKHPIGWIFCAIGLVAGVDYFSAQYATYSLLAQRASVPGSEVLAWVNSWVLVPHIGLYMFLALLFPDGRLPSARLRAVA